MERFEHVYSIGQMDWFLCCCGKIKLFIHTISCTGTVAHIEKALAENFIHIFVNNSERLTEFLEHMIRVGYVLSRHQRCVTDC